MEFDYRKLAGKIKEVYGTEKDFANALGISRVNFSLKMNNKVKFSQEEMLKAKELLDLSNLDEYFFKPKS